MPNRPWVLLALPWRYWEAEPDDDVLRLAFFQSGADDPAFPLADVELLELPKAVVVTLYERNRGASKLARLTSSVAVPLLAPLGTRTVHDGIHGERRQRLPVDAAEGSDAWHCQPAIARAEIWQHPRRGEY